VFFCIYISTKNLFLLTFSFDLLRFIYNSPVAHFLCHPVYSI